jgi:hypothetical protein
MLLNTIYPFLNLKFAFSNPGAEQFFIDLMDKSIKFREESKIQRMDYLDHLVGLKRKKEISGEFWEFVWKIDGKWMRKRFHRSGIGSSWSFVLGWWVVVDEFVVEVDLWANSIGKYLETFFKIGTYFVELAIFDALWLQSSYHFLLDGFDTSSSAISAALYEVAKNKSVQDQLRQEINDAIASDEDLTYDAVMNLPYLDQIMSGLFRYEPWKISFIIFSIFNRDSSLA